MQTRDRTPAQTATFHASYPGTAEQIHRVRADVAARLPGCPVADDVLLVVSELATNAALHSRSRDHGWFTVRIAVRTGDYVWVEIEDQGGLWVGSRPDDRPHGLDIVAAIAGDGNWGIDGDSTSGRTAWVRIDWQSAG